MRELDLDRLKTLVTIADPRLVRRRLACAAPRPADGEPARRRAGGARGHAAAAAHPRRIAPTGAGATLVERARRLLADADDALDAVRRQVAGRAGRVRLGASTGAIEHLLPRALESIGRSHPEVDVRVAVLTSEESMARLAAGTLDIGLVALPQPPRPGVRVTPWRRDPVVAFVPAAWPRPRHADARVARRAAADPQRRGHAAVAPDRRVVRRRGAAPAGAHRAELQRRDQEPRRRGLGRRAAAARGDRAAARPADRDPAAAAGTVAALGIACRAGGAEPAVAVVRAALERVEKG